MGWAFVAGAMVLMMGAIRICGVWELDFIQGVVALVFWVGVPPVVHDLALKDQFEEERGNLCAGVVGGSLFIISFLTYNSGAMRLRGDEAGVLTSIGRFSACLIDAWPLAVIISLMAGLFGAYKLTPIQRAKLVQEQTLARRAAEEQAQREQAARDEEARRNAVKLAMMERELELRDVDLFRIQRPEGAEIQYKDL